MSDEQAARLNQELQAEGLQVRSMTRSKLVGQIVEMVAHPDSDHLNICQVAVGPDKTVQIVAGAPDAREGLKTIVALPGCDDARWELDFPRPFVEKRAWDDVCSRIALTNAHKTWIIRKDTEEGTPFDPARHCKDKRVGQKSVIVEFDFVVPPAQLE